MNNNLTPIQVERGKAFMADLRANPFKAVGVMRDEYGGRCCLCVAYDTAQKMGANLPEISSESALPPEAIQDWYGWNGVNPHLAPKLKECKVPVYSASSYNDANEGATFTHAEIANRFEAIFPQLITT